VYAGAVIEIVESGTFRSWFSTLGDRVARAKIDARIRRLALGNPGKHRVLKSGICELKIDYGPGYRVYYTMRGQVLAILLCGGDKKSQQGDIARANRIAEHWRVES